jgi:hypothetical protein
LFRALRNGLERVLAAHRYPEIGPIESYRAQELSLDLLVRCLTATQRADFAHTHAFEVRGESGQHYRITYGKRANIQVLAPSGIVRRLCAGPLDVPAPAVMLAQKLMLENQETEFLRIAREIPT